MPTMPVIAVTSGEPAGIGPELCLRLAERIGKAGFQDSGVRLAILADRRMMAERAQLLNFRGELRDRTPA